MPRPRPRRDVTEKQYSDLVLSMAPVSYWRLGERSGTVARDAFGSNHGTYIASPTLGVAGALAGDGDTAVTFNGTTQYATVASSRILSGLVNFSIVGWMSATSLPTSDRAVYAERGAAGNNICGLYAETVTGRPKFIFRDDAGAIIQLVPGGGDPGLGPWTDGRPHLLAAVKFGTRASVYVDGTLAKSSLTGVSDTFTGTVSCRIGANEGGSNFFPGTIDEVVVWNRAVTEAEVAALYAAGTGR